MEKKQFIPQFKKDEYRICSNMFIAPIKVRVNVKGVKHLIEFKSSENYYQAKKFISVEIWKDIATMNPYDSKKIVNQLMTDNPDYVNPDFNSKKLDIMWNILIAKFTQNPNLYKQLQALDPEKLVETNNWHDNYWGDCVCGKKPGCLKPGKNHLGEMLKKIRLMNLI